MYNPYLPEYPSSTNERVKQHFCGSVRLEPNAFMAIPSFSEENT